MWLPVYSYLIEHPRGYILFDTGWHRDILPHGVYDKHAQIRSLSFRLLSCINQARLAAGEAVDEQLLSLGIKTQDLDYVLLSHLDCDHANGLKLVADAKHILVSDAEKQGTRHGGLTSRIRFCKRWWEDTKIRTFQWNIAEGPFKHGFDRYGDGSVMLIHLPGHSEGLCALKLTAADGRYILLYADGGYCHQVLARDDHLGLRPQHAAATHFTRPDTRTEPRQPQRREPDHARQPCQAPYHHFIQAIIPNQ